MNMLQKATELRPDYADAMAYQSLLLRQKADMVDSCHPRVAGKAGRRPARQGQGHQAEGCRKGIQVLNPQPD